MAAHYLPMMHHWTHEAQCDIYYVYTPLSLVEFRCPGNVKGPTLTTCHGLYYIKLCQGFLPFICMQNHPLCLSSQISFSLHLSDAVIH